MTAILVLGMHRSGTSAVAGMLQAGGAASAGPAVRNWDNERGHFESLALVRLNERVLARSGGHWLAAPRALHWTEEDVRERERLLATPVETGGTSGRAPLLKDPRTLLVLPFWRAARTSFHALGVVRAPLAAARSLASGRGLALAEGLALWTAHNRALEADQREHGYPLLDFDAPPAALAAALTRACARFGVAVDSDALAAAHDERLVHHDAGEPDDVAGLAEAMALHGVLRARADGADAPGAPGTPGRGARFPRSAMAAFERALAARDRAGALAAARAASAQTDAPAGVLVPAVAALVRARAFDEARALLAKAEDAGGLEPALRELLSGKVELAAGDGRAALAHLERACAAPAPYYQARRLLPHALRACGKRPEARRALLDSAELALYPHGPLAQLAEWSWSDGEPRAALEQMDAAIAAAPRHRRGRMRARRAAWLVELGARAEAEAELVTALEEDPTYPRARDELAALRATGSVSPQGRERESR